MTNYNLHSRNGRVRFIVCFALFLCHGICALQLSMVASRAPFARSIDGLASFRNQQSLKQRTQSTSSSKGVTSGLISNLAVVALKRRLVDQTYVDCDCEASSSDVLLKGQVGPVTVKGRGWKSRLGLTCRAIEATVDKCSLDIGRILSNQKLVLTTPAEGHALVALNDVDFGNFVTHPLMKPPGLPGHSGAAEGSKLEFLKDGVRVDASTESVKFLGTYLDATWQFTLQRGSGEQQAMISVEPVDATDIVLGLDSDEVAAGLTEVTSKFFNEMVFELDGTFLTFRDMMVTDKGKVPSVMFSLSILVRKFPSPGLEF